METESGQKTTKRFVENLDDVFSYLSSQSYPDGFTRDDKKRLRRKAKNFLIKDSALFYNLNGKICCLNIRTCHTLTGVS